MDPSQWSAAYNPYGQGYDAYAYGAVQDPSLYAYGAYAGYTQYPQQVGSYSIICRFCCYFSFPRIQLELYASYLFSLSVFWVQIPKFIGENC